MSTVEQIPEAAIRDAVPFAWSDLESYLETLEELPTLLNHAQLIPHVPLRALPMGARAGRRLKPDAGGVRE